MCSHMCRQNLMGLLSAGHLYVCWYSWFLWLCCELCVLLCWCLPWEVSLYDSSSFWFLHYDFWLLIPCEVPYDSLQAFLCSILKLRIQWSLISTCSLPIIWKWIKNCPFVGFFGFSWGFFGVRKRIVASLWAIPASFSRPHVPPLKVLSDLSEEVNLMIFLLPAHFAESAISALEVLRHTWPSS